MSALPSHIDAEKDLYEKFMCYCRTNSGGALEASISAAETKIPELKSNIKSSEEQKAQLEGELKQAQECKNCHG